MNNIVGLNTYREEQADLDKLAEQMAEEYEAIYHQPDEDHLEKT